MRQLTWQGQPGTEPALKWMSWSIKHSSSSAVWPHKTRCHFKQLLKRNISHLFGIFFFFCDIRFVFFVFFFCICIWAAMKWRLDVSYLIKKRTSWSFQSANKYERYASTFFSQPAWTGPAGLHWEGRWFSGSVLLSTCCSNPARVRVKPGFTSLSASSQIRWD